MSDKKLVILPTIEDLLAAGVAAGMSAMRGASPSRCAGEQLAASLFAKNVANYTTITNNMTTTAFQVPINEADMLTGATRAGWALYKKRDNMSVFWEGVGGVASQLIGRELQKTLFQG